MKSASNMSSHISGAQSENQENKKPKDGGEDIGDFSFDFTYTCEQFGRFVYADQLFHGGKIKVHNDSDPFIPKTEKEGSSESRPQPKDNSKTRVNLSDWCTKWKDLLLFRNASNKEYKIVGKRQENLCIELSDRHRSNFRSGGERRRKDGVSAHERHYRKNRAAAEEMRRKTFLPYKKTLMGCSALDPGVHEFCKGHVVEIKC